MLKHYICIFLIIVEVKMVYIYIRQDLTIETEGIYLLVNYNFKNPHY